MRELENVLERAIILSRGSSLELREELLGQGVQTVRQGSPHADLAAEGPGAGTATLEEVEREHIRRVCEDCNWTIKGAGGAAERLGLNPSTVYFRLKKLGITRPNQRLAGS